MNKKDIQNNSCLINPIIKKKKIYIPTIILNFLYIKKFKLIKNIKIKCI